MVKKHRPYSTASGEIHTPQKVTDAVFLLVRHAVLVTFQA
jgi:hypothetical protein